MHVLISIAIVSFNRPKDLRRALESVVAQTYPHLEILVCDSSSDPAVAAVLTEFAHADARVKIHHHATDLGMTYNFNYILQQARGEFFMWVADDDWLDPRAAQLLGEALNRNPIAVLANSSVNFYQRGEFESTVPPHVITGASASTRVLSYCRTVTHNSIMLGLHRRANLASLVLSEDLAHDWIYMVKVVARGPVATIPEAVLQRSLGGASESIEKLIQVRQLQKQYPQNLYRKYGTELFRGLLRDRRQLPEMTSLQVLGLALIAGGVFWYRGSVSPGLRASIKRRVSCRPFTKNPRPGNST